MHSQFIHIRRDVSAASLARQHSLRHTEQRRRERADPSVLLQDSARLQPFPRRWNFDADSTRIYRAITQALEQRHYPLSASNRSRHGVGVKGIQLDMLHATQHVGACGAREAHWRSQP